MVFGIDLPSYHGPLDLLFYLVHREELPLEDLSLAKITNQYIEYLEILEKLDLDDVGEFVDITSQLIELKAKMVLPATDETIQETEVSKEESMPQLVERLVQYKRFRDAASLLDEQSRRWQLRYARLANELPPRRVDAGEVPIARVPSSFFKDVEILQCNRIELQDLFEIGMHKSALIAMFLATLEMTRHHGLNAVQETADGPLYLQPGPAFHKSLEVAQVDNIGLLAVANSNLPVMPR